MAYPCLDNVHFRGECTLGRLGPKGQGATICNNATSQNRHSWVLRLILAGIGVAIGVAAPGAFFPITKQP